MWYWTAATTRPLVRGALERCAGVLREAWRLGLLDAETMYRLADIRNIPDEALPAGRSLRARTGR